MDAIVTAGGIPEPGEPLYEYTQGMHKAMLDLAGKPMIQWVLDALSGSRHVESVVVVGLTGEEPLHCTKPLAFIPNQGSMIDNTIAGTHKALETKPNAKWVLSVSSDIPSITPEIVDWMIAEAVKTDHEVYYNVISRADMESRFPGSKRSYIHFKDMVVCGGDMTIFQTSLITMENSLINKLIEARKNIFEQAAILGYGTLLLLLLRQLTLEAAVRRAAKALRVRARALVCPYPELGMDVDKPFQRDLLQADLSLRTAAA